MGDKDKPVQPNPAVEETTPKTPTEVTPAITEPTPEETIRENVSNAVKEKNAIENPIVEALKQEPVVPGGTPDVPTPEKGSSKTEAKPDEALLGLIEGSTGRKFENVEAAQKFIKSLNSFVGDQEIAEARKSAKLYDSLVNKVAEEKGQSIDEVKKLFADTLLSDTPKPKPEQVAPQKPVQPEIPGEYKELESKVNSLEDKAQKAELKTKYPFAAEVEEEVAIIAQKKGISYVEAFEGSPLKPLLEAKVKEESEKSPVVAPSNRSNFDVNKVQDSAKRVMTRGKESDKLDLMRNFNDALGL